MLDGIKQYLYLVVDQETYGVLTRCRSSNIANAVCKGIPNSSAMVIHYPYMGLKHGINGYEKSTVDNFKLIRKNISFKFSNASINDTEANVCEHTDQTPSGRIFDLVDFPQNLKTHEWEEKRKLANFRAEKIGNLETRCERYMSRVKQFSGDTLMLDYLSVQLREVDIEKNYYPHSIVEWSQINSVSPEAAYYELKMYYDSLSISIFRIHAIWTKYVKILNSINNEDQLSENSVFLNLESDLKFGERS